MANRKPALGLLGTQCFAWMQRHAARMIKVGDLQKPLNINGEQEKTLLKRLNQQGYILRLQNGIYMTPKTLPAGKWQPNEYQIIAQYMAIHQAAYRITGLAAFNTHGFSTQIPNRWVVYNNRISRTKTFGQTTVQFVKKKTKYARSYTREHIPGSDLKIHMTTLEVTIIDAINDWKRFQTLPQAFSWLERYCKDAIFLKKFMPLVTILANQRSIRCIGFLLERLGVDSKQLEPLCQKLRPIKSYIPLIPDQPITDKINKKWSIIENDQQLR